MPSIRRAQTPAADLSDALRAFLVRRATELTGLALVALAGAAALALVSWSVDDPSLTHAKDGRVANWLGSPGAIAADLLMQLFGIGAIALLAPLAAWGLRLVAGRPQPRLKLRLVLWIVGTGAAAAVASALPSTARWPLPTGLGGVAGDALLTGTRMAFAFLGTPARAIAGLLQSGIAILALTAACGFGLADGDEAGDDEARHRSKPEEDAEDERSDEPSWGIVSLGALVHGVLMLRAGIGRRLGARRAPLRPRSADVRLDLAPNKARDPRADAARLPTRDPMQALAQNVAQDEPQDFAPPRAGVRRDPGFEARPGVDPTPEGQPAAGAAEGPRVIMPAAAPKPGKRLQREAQPSFLEAGSYVLPPLTLLAEPRKAGQAPTISADALAQNAALLESVLDDFGVRGEIINVRPGPVVTLYELEPAPGTKSSRVISLADDIARSMSAVSARVAVVQGRNAIGIELPNAKRETVFLRELLASQDFEGSKFRLALCLGKTIGGEPVIADLARMPHLLVAGTTGSGKSVAINTMILSLIYRLKPEECRLIMVDPKMLELSVYDGIPHLLSPVVTDPRKAVVALKWAVREMEERYKKMSKVGVRNIEGFNARVVEANARGEVITRTVQTGFDRETGEAIYEDEIMDLDPLPFIVVIVDEMADLMMVAGKDIEGAIQRLAQMARAAGIHLIMATQRPSVDVITGTIKANFPTRISFQVTSKIDSRTILGEQGAEQLLGQGDMLHMAGGGRIARVHGPFVADNEVEKIVAHLKSQGRPQYLDAVTAGEGEEAEGDGDGGPVFDNGAMGLGGGDLYDQAIAIVLRDKKASTSYIQRRLQIGYNRAASIMERMQNEGIVGPANHAGKREILLESPHHDGDEE
jgi:DNA segregation ATPase FtsK/SpoIIIE, S-DNA-T family